MEGCLQFPVKRLSEEKWWKRLDLLALSTGTSQTPLLPVNTMFNRKGRDELPETPLFPLEAFQRQQPSELLDF